ncbi:ATPase [Candidatus Methylomirabilis lanthanidiphila]|uniref:ATPase n=1 Tax=Candidatus Methylomirabilis lanthanidiphila TaxID=2211376 RepID=A0A564ZFF7_9BACT|nr:ATP-binding protein [Candidatus Methylomirabilis lanthanidiphila]VUZ84040.1 ATPase [Candidatus Methylomirabilis lanthanidiphila]
MSLHPVLNDKLSAAVAPGLELAATPRDVTLPPIPGKVHAVVGMRRAGKTTYLRQLQSQWRTSAEAARVVYLSFDDDRLAGLPLEQLGMLLEEYYRRYPDWRRRATVWWLLDEIQVVNGWERFVRRVMDTERVQMVVSGSSARMLSREVHTSLRGRGTETIIRPFSFREFLRHRGQEPEGEARSLAAPERSRVEQLLGEYLTAGGFPEAQGLASGLRIDLLQGYVDTVLFRDIVERRSVTQVAALRWLTRQCLKNPTGRFSVHRLHQDLKAQGLGVAKDALHAMVGYLEDSFLLRCVPLATESERRRNSNPRKVYPVDTGMIGAFDRTGRSNVGYALETVVLHELDRRQAEVGYVRTEAGYEVDFLARFHDGREELIQVCADIGTAETREREVRALEDASREHPRATQTLIVLNFDQLSLKVPPGVTVHAAYQWLLDAD